MIVLILAFYLSRLSDLLAEALNMPFDELLGLPPDDFSISNIYKGIWGHLSKVTCKGSFKRWLRVIGVSDIVVKYRKPCELM